MERKDNSDSKKYRFYRKPSLRRKGPEIKHTKTSLARILIANPLLKKKLENEDHKNEKKLTNINRVSFIKTRGPTCLNLKVPNFSNIRLSISDFNKQILSSTRILEDDVFVCDKHKEQTQNNKVSSRNIEKENKCPKFKEKKSKEIRALLKNSSGSTKRRSRSLDSSMLPTNCYKIEEQYTLEGMSQAHSEQNFSTMLAHTDTPFRCSEEIDEENKENVDIGLVDADSYENLVIRNPY